MKKTISLGQGESNQAIDNTWVTIYEFDINCDTGDPAKDVDQMFVYLDYSDSLNWDEINTELDAFYNGGGVLYR